MGFHENDRNLESKNLGSQETNNGKEERIRRYIPYKEMHLEKSKAMKIFSA